MKNKEIAKSLIAILTIMVIISLVLITQNISFNNLIWENEPFHSFIESIGGFIAIIMAIIISDVLKEINRPQRKESGL